MSGSQRATRFHQRRDDILDEALLLFAAEGLDVGMKRIASALGLTHPALYHYFGSKEELVTDAVEKAMGDLLGAMEAAHAIVPPHPAAELTALARAQVRHELAGRTVVPFLNALLYGPLRKAATLEEGQWQRIRTRQRCVLGLYRDVIARGQAEGDFVAGSPTVLAFGVMGLTSYAVFWFADDGPLDAAAVAERLASQALRSVSALVER